MEDNMANELGDKLAAAAVDLIALSQAVTRNDKQDVADEIATQQAFFAMVQKRSDALNADVAKGKNRLSPPRRTTWLVETARQLEQDLRDAQAAALTMPAEELDALKAVVQEIRTRLNERLDTFLQGNA
ncbi:MAG TPA: hypothetical protein PKL46_09340 [Aquabacterium sp.]|nr:hypothetical protein [Aquabacterium sp.]